MKKLVIISILGFFCLKVSAQGSVNGHEYVDLGLSVKWATCNVGADSPEDYGDYFAWGETKTKSEYTEESSTAYEKLLGDIKGDNRYDAATANWGGNWRMPTGEEFKELKNKCICQWTTQNGVKGYKVTGPNGNSIFLPAAGSCYESSLNNDGKYGSYWSSESDWSWLDYDVKEHTACYFDFNVSECDLVCYDFCIYGMSIRPVTDGRLGNGIRKYESSLVSDNSDYYEEVVESGGDITELAIEVSEEYLPDEWVGLTPRNNEQDNIESVQLAQSEVFKSVEEMPEFYAGTAKMMEYIQKNIEYPIEARESDIQGRVFVNFIVETDGSLSNVNVMRGIGGGCDEEAVRVVESMPKWKPGKQDGSAVRVSFTIPIIFKLKETSSVNDH